MDINKIIGISISLLPIAFIIYFAAYYRGYNYRSKMIEGEWETIQNFKNIKQKIVDKRAKDNLISAMTKNANN